MKRLSVIALLLAFAVTATGSKTSTVTFYKDILPILQDHCQSCHRPGQLAPISFVSYKETRPWAEAIKHTVQARQMPPWLTNVSYPPSQRHRALNLREIDTVVKWVEGGVVEGDPQDAPPPVYFEQGLKRLDVDFNALASARDAERD